MSKKFSMAIFDVDFLFYSEMLNFKVLYKASSDIIVKRLGLGLGLGMGMGNEKWEMGNREYPQSQEMTV